MKVSIAEFDYKEILEAEKKRPVIDGVKFQHLLGLLFIGLKLTSVIAWSWWWVLAPFWIPALVYALVATFLKVSGIVTVTFKSDDEEPEQSEPVEKQERVLDAPSKYPLVDCLKELKFGRPVESQKLLDKWISELTGA